MLPFHGVQFAQLSAYERRCLRYRGRGRRLLLIKLNNIFNMLIFFISPFLLQQWRQRGGCHTQTGGGSDQIGRGLPDTYRHIGNTTGGR